tara:strand:+ start:112 stop:429 length:318 start_codon:yes stop_codon:yes gene_type:complete
MVQPDFTSVEARSNSSTVLTRITSPAGIGNGGALGNQEKFGTTPKTWTENKRPRKANGKMLENLIVFLEGWFLKISQGFSYRKQKSEESMKTYRKGEGFRELATS